MTENTTDTSPPTHVTTNRYLGDLIGCHPTQASRVRNGKSRPTYRAIIAISHRYNWPIDQQITALADGTWAQQAPHYIGVPPDPYNLR